MLFVTGYHRPIFGNFTVRFNKFAFNFPEKGGKTTPSAEL